MYTRHAFQPATSLFPPSAPWSPATGGSGRDRLDGVCSSPLFRTSSINHDIFFKVSLRFFHFVYPENIAARAAHVVVAILSRSERTNETLEKWHKRILSANTSHFRLGHPREASFAAAIPETGNNFRARLRCLLATHSSLHNGSIE